MFKSEGYANKDAKLPLSDRDCSRSSQLAGNDRRVISQCAVLCGDDVEVIDGLVHHSDRGVQYTLIRYPERLREAGAVRSAGSKGDSYDNVTGLYKEIT